MKIDATVPAAVRQTSRCAAVLAAVLALAGCATAVATPEEQVTRLAQERWAHKINGDWKSAYEMLTPAYRQLHSQREYQAQFKGAVNWQRAEVASTSCEPQKCEVRIALTVTSPLARGKGDTIHTFFNETWLNEGGHWYYYEKP